MDEKHAGRLVGSITSFDAHVGLGTVDLDDGRRVPFHCAEIVDGTRHIDVGTRVSCDVRSKFQRPEAFGLVSL